MTPAVFMLIVMFWAVLQNKSSDTAALLKGYSNTILTLTLS